MKNIIFTFLLVTGSVSHAAAQAVATVTHLSGILTARYPDGSSKLLSVKSEIDRGALLVTEKDTFARLKFNDASEIVLRPGSELRVDEFHYEENSPAADSLALSMLKGGMRAVSGLIGKRNRDAVKYTTPTATIGVRGTHFGALFCNADCGGIPTIDGTVPADGLHVDVAQGAIQLTNAAASIPVNMGQFGFVAGSGVVPVLVSPEHGVQVTMPTSISQNKGSSTGGMAQKSDETQCVAR
jgi:hypothetical protein